MAALVQHLGTGRRKTRGGPSVSAAGQRQDHRQRPDLRTLFSERRRRGAIVKQPLLATETADKFDILITHRTAADPRGRPARRSWALRARCSSSTRAARQAEGARLPHARCARARAQEVRTEGRSQTLPVLEALTVANARPGGDCVVSAGLEPSSPFRFSPGADKFRFGPLRLESGVQPNAVRGKEVFCRRLP